MKKNRYYTSGKTRFFAIFRNVPGASLHLDYAEEILNKPYWSQFDTAMSDRVILGFKTRRQRDHAVEYILNNHHRVETIPDSYNALDTKQLKQIAIISKRAPKVFHRVFPVLFTFVEKYGEPLRNLMDKWVSYMVEIPANYGETKGEVQC